MQNALPWAGLLVAALFVLVPVLMVVMGVVAVVSPRTAWWLSEGWKYRNLEPSGCALAATRLGGLVGVAVGLAFLTAVLLFLAGSVRVQPAGQQNPPPAPPRVTAA